MRKKGLRILAAIGAGSAIGGCLFAIIGVCMDLLSPSKVPATVVLPPIAALHGAVAGVLVAAWRVGVLPRILALCGIGIGLALLLEAAARVLGWR